MISMTDFFLTHNSETILPLIKLFKLSHIEIIPYYGNGDIKENYSIEKYIKHLFEVRSYGTKIIIKCLGIPVEPISQSLIENKVIDGIIVKTSKGAGKVSKAHPDLIELVIKTKLLYPNINIISSGGISSSVEIMNAIRAGSAAVGLGTIFALSKESRLCIENKVKLLFKSSKDIEEMEARGLGQNAIIFEQHEGWDNENHSKSLEKGISGTGGHVFMGHGIDNIKEILSVSEIVAKLTQDLV